MAPKRTGVAGSCASGIAIGWPGKSRAVMLYDLVLTKVGDLAPIDGRRPASVFPGFAVICTVGMLDNVLPAAGISKTCPTLMRLRINDVI